MESEYEVQRLLNIKRNQAIMDTLGIGSTLQVVNAFNTAPKPVRPSACKRKRTTPDPTTIPPRKMPRRESGRCVVVSVFRVPGWEPCGETLWFAQAGRNQANRT